MSKFVFSGFAVLLTAVTAFAQWGDPPLEGFTMRFIRLEHSGRGWDDGMTAKTGTADSNFLRQFAKVTGFKAAKDGESHPVKILEKYPKNGRPPFVYITGNDQLGRFSSRDIKTLRKYCLEGGLLVADAGSPAFHKSFVYFIRQVFPDKPMVDIADDDQIYQLPYAFPNGAPAFWHHGGRRALGVRHEGRWCVFYHPGDLNDAWKAATHSDVRDAMRTAAYNLGVNLVYYAFTHSPSALDGDPSYSVPLGAGASEKPIKVDDRPAELKLAESLEKTAAMLKEKAATLSGEDAEAAREAVENAEEVARELRLKAAEIERLKLEREKDGERVRAPDEE